MALQHRIRRIVIGLGLILIAVCAVVATLYLYAGLLFVPGLFLVLSGCLDEFPDDEPETAQRRKPFYARPWFLLLITIAVAAGAFFTAQALIPKIEPSDHHPAESPVTAAKEPESWISQGDVADERADALVTVGTGDDDEAVETYVINTNTRKFHRQSCSAVEQMDESNKEFVTGTSSAVAAMGYAACKNCKP